MDDKDVRCGGIWNISGKKYNGELIHNTSNGIILLSIFYKCSDFTAKDMPHTFYDQIINISGEISTGAKCSLYNCRIVKNHSSNFVYHTISFKADYLIYGIKSEEIMNFNKVQFKISNIIPWSNLSGLEMLFEKEELKDYPLAIGYKYKKDIELNIDANTKIRFVPILGSHNFNIDVEEYKITQDVYISIEKNEKEPIESFYQNFNFVKNLITFATNEYIKINGIFCYNNDYFNTLENGIKVETKFEMISKKMKSEKENYKNEKWNYLYLLTDLKERNLLDSFLQNYKKNEQVFEFYISSRLYTNSSISFVNLIQAVELYNSNKLKRKDKFMKSIKEKFKNNNEIVDNIENNFDQKDAYYVILRSRIIDFLNYKDNPLNIYNDWPSKTIALADIISNTRNYYIHYDNSKKDKALKGDNLKYCYWLVSTMLDIQLLLDIGFDIDFINKKLEHILRMYEHRNIIDNIINHSK